MVKRIKALYLSYRWQFWATIAALGGIAAMLLRNLLLKPGPEKSGDTTYLPEPPKALAVKVEKVEKEALIARVEARVVADQDVKKLAEVSEISDGVERRKRLAEMLRGL